RIGDLDCQRGVAVGRERDFQELLAVALDHVGQVVVPNAGIPLEIEVFQEEVDGVVASEASAPALEIFAELILEYLNGLPDEAQLLVRRVVAHHLVLVSVTGDRMAGLLYRAGDVRILLDRRAAGDPGAEHVVLTQDFEKPPGATPAAVLPLAEVERIDLAVAEHHGGLLGLMVHADDDRQAHTLRPLALLGQRDFDPHDRPQFLLLHHAAISAQRANWMSFLMTSRSMNCRSTRTFAGRPVAQVWIDRIMKRVARSLSR